MKNKSQILEGPFTYRKAKRGGLFYIETALDAPFAGIYLCSTDKEVKAAIICDALNLPYNKNYNGK